MHKIMTALFCLILMTGMPAFAASACYNAREVEAEQGLRIQTELMVIALTCVKMPDGGAGLYAQYQSFVEKHRNLLAGYEGDMLSYYKARGKGADEKLHNLKTKLANDISTRAINMSITQFCHRFGPRIPQAMTMDEAKLRRWAQHVWPQSPTTVAACRKKS